MNELHAVAPGRAAGGEGGLRGSPPQLLNKPSLIPYKQQTSHERNDLSKLKTQVKKVQTESNLIIY